MKTNVIGLGNYINTINREVNNLASRTRDSLENVNQQVVELTADVKMIEVNEIKIAKKKSNQFCIHTCSDYNKHFPFNRTIRSGFETPPPLLEMAILEPFSDPMKPKRFDFIQKLIWNFPLPFLGPKMPPPIINQCLIQRPLMVPK